MGISKIPGEFVEEMTEPLGWPDIDETGLQERATEFLGLRNNVSWTTTSWRERRSQVFDGGIWSGRGAEAGSTSIQQRINEMDTLETHLGKGYAYYNLVAGIVTQTKTVINRNLAAANSKIQELRDTPELSLATKEALIRLYVAWQNSLNTAEVESMAGQVPSFTNWTPSSIEIPPPAATPANQPAPPPPRTFGHDGSAPLATSPASYFGPQQNSPHTFGGDHAGATFGGDRPAAFEGHTSGTSLEAAQATARPSGADPVMTGGPSGFGTSSPSGSSPSASSVSSSGPPAGGTSSPSSPSASGTSSPASAPTANSPTPVTGAGNPNTTASASDTAKSARTTTPLQPMASQPPLASSAPATSPAPAPAPTNQAAAAAPDRTSVV